MRTMNSLLLAGAMLAILPQAPVKAQTTHTITVRDNSFSPANLTIQVGDTVRWVNAAGGNRHDMTPRIPDAGFGWLASETASSWEHEVTFTDPGAFEYFCSVHPFIMQGTITVQGGQQATAELELLSVEVIAGTFAPGENIDIRTRVRNTGDAEASGWSLDLFLSDDATIEETDIALATVQGVTLQPTDTDNRVARVALPGDLAPGSYIIGAIVEFDDANTANNVNHDPVEQVFVAFVINPGLNDAWFNSATAGQGFFIIVFEDTGIVFLAWFTYDTELPPDDIVAMLGAAEHRWLTAQGPYVGNTAVLDVFLTEGGVFDMSEPEPVTGQQPIGAITIVWDDCESGTLIYNFPDLGLMGEIPISRIVPDNIPLCEELNGMQQGG